MSLYGTVSARTHASYEKQTSALNANAALINRFESAVIEPFDLIPHIQAMNSGQVGLVAHCPRGRDYAMTMAELEESGYEVGVAEKLPYQFRDGWVIWAVPVTGPVCFCLVFYASLDVS